MNQEYLKLLDKVSLSILRNIGRLEDELSGSDLDAAREVSASIPAILLAIAVQRLSMDLPPDEVSSLLQAMVAKVEIGDFHSGPEGLQRAADPGQGGPSGEDGGGGGGGAPN
jgi:hypothetical protein